MAIKIQTQQTGIPVELGDLKFSFDVSDESIAKFRDNAKKIQKELADLEKIQEENESLIAAKKALKKGFDLTLGEGAFEKIYDMSPSIIIVTQYFTQIHEGIEDELNKMFSKNNQQEKAQKYLNKKQSNNQKQNNNRKR